MNHIVDPGKTYDYTSPECNRRDGEERRKGLKERRFQKEYHSIESTGDGGYMAVYGPTENGPWKICIREGCSEEYQRRTTKDRRAITN